MLKNNNMNNNEQIKNKLKKRKEIFYETNSLEKYDKRINTIKKILLKKTSKRTLNENRILLNYLIENFNYFKNIQKERDQL